MASYRTRIEARLGSHLSAEEIFAISRAREVTLSRILMLYVVTGLFFMLLPGTFLGVWNLLSISSQRAAASVSAAWIQAHGHAQIFGWVGSFILGIGFYSIPKLRRLEPFAIWTALACWTMWTAGVSLRWLANVYLWHWRALLPVSAALEVIAFVFFFQAVSRHRAPVVAGARAKFEPWVLMIIGASVGLMATLLANLGLTIYLALYGKDAAFPHAFDQRFLVLSTWAFMVPFVWGFSAKWMPIFLALKAPRPRLLMAVLALNSGGVLVGLAGMFRLCSLLLLVAAILSVVALRLFEPAQGSPKTKGVHVTFPHFVRLAYAWLAVAGALAVWASRSDSAGVWGAARHALTVGFVSTVVFSVGQRILPAFCGMRLLFSRVLMVVCLALLTLGCFLRVASEILAYQGYASWAWEWLPVSAVMELAAVSVFAFNLLLSFAQRPPSVAA
jgi:uncharacterized protein involved in response to NO